MDFVPMAVLTALVKKLVDFVKYGVNGDVNAVVTQLASWGAGVVVAIVAARSDWGAVIAINQTSLAALNNWSLALVGMNLASVAGVGWDLTKALDNSNSAIIPNLLGSVGVTQGTPGNPAPVPTNSP